MKPIALKQQAGYATGGVLATLRLEGAVLIVSALCGFYAVHGRWLWFALLFLAPDLAFLAYLLNARVGARI